VSEKATFDLVGSRTLPQFLDERIERQPAKIAVAFESPDGRVREYSYAELGDISARVAGGLARLGIGVGDKVVIHLPNCPEFVFAFFGLAHLGAVGVPSNIANRIAEMTHVIGWSDARMVITSPRFLDLIEEVIPRTPAVEHVVIADGEARAPALGFAELMAAEPIPPPDSDSEAPVEIVFTSGTTSLPKGVVLTHANWLWSGERASRSFGVTDRDRLLTALPLFHVNAQSFTLMPALTVGATAIFVEPYSASRFMEQVRRHEATHISLVAMLVRTLLAQSESPLDAQHSVRRVTYAINVTCAEKTAFEERFGVELINGYGLSEAMTEVTVAPVYGAKRWPSIGQPAFGREVRLVDPAGTVVGGPGDVGEITVRGVPGRTIMKEYYKDPSSTAQAIVDGWLHTGDNGYFDDLGYLYFFDRAKDVIKRAGENISASEVEGVLTDHAGVALAAVIGVPDPIRDEAVMAFIVPEDGADLTEEEIIRHCEARLARFKVPTIVEFHASLPITSIGKVEKKQLRMMVESRTVEAR
jgi:carnitine-CoA ligase